MLLQLLAKNTHTGIDGTGKVLFLCLDHADDVGSAFTQIAIVALVLLDNSLNNLIQERTVHTQELTVTGGTTEQAAQNIAAAFVGRLYSVSNHKGRCADMVGDNTQAHIGLIALTVGSAGNIGNVVGNVHNRVHIEQRVYILADNSQTLQTHTGIDVLLNQFGVVTVAVIVELGEHIVPDLDESVALTANLTIGATTAVLLTTVIVNFRAGATGTGAVLPEVISLTETEDILGRNANFLVPDFKGFLVIFIDRGIQPILFQTNNLGQKLPAPGNGLVLKVVTKREVTQHFKIGTVTGSLTDVLNVTGADTLLTGTYSSSGRLHLTLKIGLHRRHTGID